MKRVKKLILHIGVHKTGTTAIQTFLHENKEALEKQGIYAPAFLHGPEHKATVLRTSVIRKSEAKTRGYLNKVVESARASACDCVIISDEDYSKTNEVDLGDVKIFSEFFEEITVLMYCRRPDRQSESGYAFCVMWEGTKYRGSPETWYGDNPGNDYYRHANFYQEAIPGCKVKVVSYDFNAKRLVPSFMEACGMEDFSYALPDKKASNISANKYMVEVMNELNQFPMTDKVFLAVKAEVLAHPKLQGGPKAIFFSEDQRRLNQGRIQARIRAFEETFYGGQPLFDEFVTVPVPKGLDSKSKEKIVEELIRKHGLKDKRTMGLLAGLKKLAKRIVEG